MITYKCGMCKEEIAATKENIEGIVYFDKRYWHKDCFIDECNRKIKSNRSKKYDWQDVLNSISEWQECARVKFKAAVEKDDLFNFITLNYNISLISNSLFVRLNSIYDGSYRGLLYPISPDELLEEWKYYMPFLQNVRRHKDMTAEQAIPYDLAILLSKNVEYRRIVEQKRVENQIREAQRSKESDVDLSKIHGPARNSRRLAILYDDFMGGDS